MLSTRLCLVDTQLTFAVQPSNRGEQTARALEANLSSLESKLDEMLASLGGSAAELDALDEEEEEEQEEKKQQQQGGQKDDVKGSAAGEGKK